jgi:hypothetical protein
MNTEATIAVSTAADKLLQCKDNLHIAWASATPPERFELLDIAALVEKAVAKLRQFQGK